MNRTILKLFTQACYHGEYDPENVPNDVVEKFAELIVRECAQVAEEVDGDSRARKCVLEHFGVKV